jgi:4-methyl-5(b-hydroxyethyl)-thiazole monophosphate biosynthesis
MVYVWYRSTAMPKKALILLAEGFEEVEAITPIDYLRRAGIEACTAAVGGKRTVTGAHGIPVTADILLADAAGKAPWDAIVLPGGMPGASNLAASKETAALLTGAVASGALICAICASPAVVLAPLGLLSGKKFTCYPGMEGTVPAAAGARWSEDRVVTDAGGTYCLITSRGAGTAADFAIAVISKLLSEAEGEKIAKSVVMPSMT